MRFPAVLLLLAGALFATTSCDHSDAGDAQRAWRRDNARRIAGMKAATAEQERGRAVEGEELRAFVSNRTHVFEYGSDPLGRKVHYIEYDYFRPDGRFVFMNSEYANDPAGKPEDKWRVDGKRLCIVNSWLTMEERCFTIALLPTGRVQYYIDKPGEESHGLLTKVTDSIQEGSPQPYRR